MTIYQLQQENWGVCGFISAIQAAYMNNKEIQVAEKPIASRFGNEEATRQEVLATSHDLLEHFIRVFDRYCSASIANDIVKFTRSFGDEFRKPNNDVTALSAYCQMMYDDGTFIDTGKIKKPSLGFALTPDAMDFLLRKIFSFNISPFRHITLPEWKSILENDKDFSKLKNVIVGFSNDTIDEAGNFYGLRHWIYIDKEGHPYSWGEKYKSLKDFFIDMPTYKRICYTFSI